MMRSLWAGVTGLQAHQIAMDVEGNNIANVNTTGFKYSRANFSDLLSQTAKIATAPQGELGGKNSMQIGLGTQISSVTKIFKQGSIETTDKNTDLAIQGDGFFVVSPDGGSTYKYTRNGDFMFDASGNFVESNGYIIQGWMKDDTTGEIDATAPIRNITIPPGLTTPANDTGYITLKANLNSGDTTKNKSTIYQLDQFSGWYDKDENNVRSSTEKLDVDNDDIYNADREQVERAVDMSVIFDANGEAINLREDEGLWISYKEAQTHQMTITAPDSSETLKMTLNGESLTIALTTTAAIAGNPTEDENAALTTEILEAINNLSTLKGLGVEAKVGDDKNKIYFVNNNKTGSTDKSKNIKIDIDGTVTHSSIGLVDTTVITAYQYAYAATTTTARHEYKDTVVRDFHSTEDLRAAMQEDARYYTNYNGDQVDADGWDDDDTIVADNMPWSDVADNNKNDGVTVTVNEEGKFVINNPSGDAPEIFTGDLTETEINDILLDQNVLFPEGTEFLTAATLPIGFTGTVTINGVDYVGGNVIPATTVTTAEITLPLGTTFAAAALPTDPVINVTDLGITDLNGDGSADDQAMFLSITGRTDQTTSKTVSVNTGLTTIFSALQGALSTGTSERTTQSIYMASHASSIDVYDSLGSKHTIRFEFRKIGQSETGGTEWSLSIVADKTAKINYSGTGLENVVTGTIGFNSDGSLSNPSITSLQFTANNGSAPNQNIELRFGTTGQFDGMTSFDKESNTSGISQDGYPGGDLAGIRVDETGTLIGSFTNGRSFGLAQVAMAKFTNNEGLESDGGNTFIQTSNSGDPVIGSAATGGRGFVQASSLEMSNVDLSRSLTQLIVIQRGYQANSKTITTSDQMLNTLLQLKQ